MTKYVATPVGSGFGAQSNLNQNFEDIEDNFQRVLYRDGSTPNQMESDLDMNDFDIINVNNINTSSLAINGQQVVANETFVTPLPDPTGQTSKFIKSDGVSTSWQFLVNTDIDGLAPIQVDTVADMKALTGLADGAEVTTAGYTTVGDGGYGTYIYDAASTTTPDDFLVHQPSVGSGRFKLKHNGMAFIQQAGAVPDDTTNSYAAFVRAAAQTTVAIFVPGNYVCNDAVNILSNQVWIFAGKVRHTDDTKSIFVATDKTNFHLLGSLVLAGTLVTAATAAETGLVISGCTKFTVENVTAQNFKGKGFFCTGSTAITTGRGNKGKFSNCAAYDCTTGILIDALGSAEYHTWSNTNVGNCVTGVDMAAGNNVFVGGNIVDNSVNVELRSGTNHCHGIFSGVNINHGTPFNLIATGVVNGHTFSGCHFYGNGSGSGAIYFNNCKGITITGGTIDCWIYNDSDGSSGYNFVTNNYLPGDYGFKVTSLDGSEAQLICKDNFGPGRPTSVIARRAVSSTQSVGTGTTLTYQSVGPDTASDMNAGTGIYTVPQTGTYKVSFSLTFSGTSLTTAGSYVDVTYDGISRNIFGLIQYSSSLLLCSGESEYFIQEGLQIKLLATIAGTSPLFGSAVSGSFVRIERIS